MTSGSGLGTMTYIEVFLAKDIEEAHRQHILATIQPFKKKRDYHLNLDFDHFVQVHDLDEEAHPTWMSAWVDGFHEAIAPHHRGNAFQCFITNKHITDADVTYALHCRHFAVLSLSSQPDTKKVMAKTPPLFYDIASLSPNGSALEAISSFFYFPPIRGRIFVIEGGDGAGKETQTKRMVQRLESEGFPVATIDFPNDHCLTGTTIREILSGYRGHPSPYKNAFATLYAANRLEKSYLIHHWVQRGVNIIMDRYMTANFAYQAHTVALEERRQHVDSIEKFEVETLQIPKAHRVIYLDLHPEIAMRAMRDSRDELDLYERQHIGIKLKIRSCFFWCCEEFPDWSHVRCTKEDSVDSIRYSREELHNMLYEIWLPELVPRQVTL